MRCGSDAGQFFGIALVILAFAASAIRQLYAADPPHDGQPPPRALLVGCTTYDFNRERLLKGLIPEDRVSLKGSGNDVAIMYELLVDRFGFHSQDIRRLIEGLGPENRPTRTNIVREIELLIREAGKDQRIVLFFAGHGCQQPDQDPSDPNDPEPDGLDEVFLPADAGPWTDDIQSIRNAIVDDEFRKWTAQLLSKKVELLVVFDSCHSGSALRGIGDEQMRRVEPEVLIPEKVLQRARSRVESTRGSASLHEPAFDALADGNWVALYAAQPEEQTIERRLPQGQADARRHGLFTYSLCQVLREGHVSSYRDLIEAIRGRYLGQGQLRPTPLIEGPTLERAIFGAERREPTFTLKQDAKNHWYVLGGQLHGVNNASILAVRVLGAAPNTPPVGHVQVIESELERARVVSCSYRNHPRLNKLPADGRCHLVFADYGDMRLKVAVDAESTRGTSTDNLLASLRALAAQDTAVLALLDDLTAADWIVSKRQTPRGSRWILSPRSTAQQVRGPAIPLDSSAAEFAFDETDPTKLDALLRTITRATNLLALSGRLGNVGESSYLKVQLEVLYYSIGKDQPIVVPIDRLPELNANGKVAFRLTNRGSEPVDFTLLYVDSAFGISAVFPKNYAADNRLQPGKSYQTRLMTVTADTLGREHLVLIAVPASGAPKSFAFLAQPNLASAQAELHQTRGADSDSQFARFLQQTAFGQGGTRGIDMADEENLPIIQTRSWMVSP